MGKIHQVVIPYTKTTYNQGYLLKQANKYKAKTKQVNKTKNKKTKMLKRIKDFFSATFLNNDCVTYET